MKQYRSIRTDLALESREMLQSESTSDEINGVEIEVEDHGKGITVTWVRITNEEGSEAMGKPMGNYITIESEAMKENETEIHEEIIRLLAQKLGQLHQLKSDSTVLVVGLGNWQVTPDALGPQVVSRIMVTRHLAADIPTALKGKVRAVSAIAPGVMGLTGIETSEIVKGVTEKINPDLVIAIDALAARRTNRINATVQMTDTGVNPGAGLGNKRLPLNQQTLGVPIIALGIPTVVDAATLVNDTMDRMLETMAVEMPKGSAFYNMLIELEDEEKYSLIKDILDPYAGNMFVTPKEVDAVMLRLTNIIANALNIALHPGVTTEDMNRYLN